MMTMTDKVFCVIDHGLFLPLAHRLADSGAKVYYHNPSWMKGFPIISEAVIGDGYEDIECVPDLYDVVSKVDTFVFPDIFHAGLQKHLRSLGKAVWGSGDGMKLEIDRQYFLNTLEDLGLDVPEYKSIKGISNLKAYLKDKKDIWIKVSKFRGTFETKHFRSWELDEKLLDVWAFRLGGLKELIPFLCFTKIDTQLEIGSDTYSIDGQWPETMLHGMEWKDAAYLAAVTKKKDMPEQVLPIMEAFSPMLKQLNYRCQWSMEVRVTEKENFFIDATTRGGMPSTGSQLLLWKNFPEIIYFGARGQMVEPEPVAKFAAECMVKLSGEQGAWESIEIPEEIKKNLRCYNCCKVGDLEWFSPDQPFVTEQHGSVKEIGWLVAQGNTPTEVAKEMNRLADLLPDACDAKVEALASIIKEVEVEKEEGIHFTDMPMPDTSIVLES